MSSVGKHLHGKGISASYVIFTMSLMAVILFSIGCQAKAPEATQEFRFLLQSAPTELDPTQTNESFATPIIYHVYEPLLREDSQGKLIPGLAERWEVSEENTRFTFYLRKNAKWTNGEGITAQQVRDTFLYILDPQTASKNVGILSPYVVNASAFNQGTLKKEDVAIKAIDDYTVQIDTIGPTPFFLNLMSFINLSPVLVDQIISRGPDWDQHPEDYISNGPYKMVEIVPNERVVIEKNPNYWNASTIAIDRITYYFLKADQDPIQLYQDGIVDGIYELEPSKLRTYPELESEVHSHIAPSTSFMVVNHRKPLFQDIRLRKALDQTIPRDLIVSDVISGSGIATQFLVPINYHLAGQPFHDFTALVAPTSVSDAKLAIEEIRKESNAFNQPLELLAMDTGPDKNVAEAIAKHWKETLNIDVSVTAMPWGDLFDRALKGEYDLIMLGFGGDYPHPMTFLSNFQKDGILTQIIGWYDPTIDDLIKSALSLTDEAEALDAFRNIEKQLLDQSPIFNLYYRKKITLMSQKVTGWYRNSSSQFVFTEAQIKP